VATASPVAVAGADETDAAPEGGLLSYARTVGGVKVATGSVPTNTVPVGTTTVVLTITDANGAMANDEVSITVESAPAPTAEEETLG